MMNESSVVPLAIVGGGPAGLSAAVSAGTAGIRSVLIDAGARPGGQYWRHSSAAPSGDRQLDELASRLATLVAEGMVSYLPGKQVWFVQRAASGAFTMRLNDSGAVTDPAAYRLVAAERLLLCPGGYDRQLPIPGWDLPGVMSAGGLQAMIKEHRVTAGTRVLLGGTGPFLLPVATALASAGATVVGVCEANKVTGWWRARREMVSGASVFAGKLVEAGGYAARLVQHRIPYHQGAMISRIDGDGCVSAATITRVGGETIREGEVDAVGLGWGFTPSLELVLALGLETKVDVDGSLVAVVDARQASTVPGVWVAGEATGVGGAVKAGYEGSLAAMAVAAELGHAVDSAQAVKLQRKVRSWRAFASAMHRAYPMPQNWSHALTSETVVCRCEEVTLADIRSAQRDLGADNPRLVKLVTRAGMGWCQGRICGLAVGELCGGRTDPAVAADLISLGSRPLAFPVTMGEIATMADPLE